MKSSETFKPFPKGYGRIFSYRGAPIYLHWSVLLFALLLINKPEPLITIPAGLLSIVFIHFVHEIGHAFFLGIYGYNIEYVKIYAFGGACAYSDDGAESKELMISAGGILFQLLLMVIWYLIFYLFHVFDVNCFPAIIQTLTGFFIFLNSIIIIINLLPIKGLDGYEIVKSFMAILSNIHKIR
jgi:Zn-dependent protease